MKKVHLVIADLFLPEEFAACAGLHLPYLEKMLARGVSTKPLVLSSVEGAARTADSRLSLEEYLCGLFGVQTGVANVSAAFDGLGEGCWLRADPVHLRLQREQVVLLPNVALSHDEAQCFCTSLNEHFADQGMEFFAPHPDRWYVKLDELPDIVTVPLSQAAGRNIRGNLPGGTDARRLNQIFNEIQMLLFAHPLNEAREARGDVPVNSVWLWGNGQNRMTTKNDFASASSDQVLVQMLAASANIPFSGWQPVWRGDTTLLVWCGLRSALQRGDLAAWRDALQEFETGYARPLWQALRRGQISQLQIDIPGGDGMMTVNLSRADTFAFWRRAGKLSGYPVPSTRE